MSVQQALTLGAVDLKKSYNRNLAIAFAIALLFHITLLGGQYVLAIIFNLGNPVNQEANYTDAGPITLDEFKDETIEDLEVQTQDALPPPPPMSVVDQTGSGSEGKIGDIVAAADELVEGPEIADIDEIAFADNLGGNDGNAKLFDPSKIELPKEDLNINPAPPSVTPEEYGIDDFVPEANPPTYNKGELRDLIDYPTLARENGIEGIVTVGVQVSKTGKPLKVIVRNSTNKTFNESALKAVRKLRFTPAVQNGHPIKMWLTFRVEFELN